MGKSTVAMIPLKPLAKHLDNDQTLFSDQDQNSCSYCLVGTEGSIFALTESRAGQLVTKALAGFTVEKKEYCVHMIPSVNVKCNQVQITLSALQRLPAVERIATRRALSCILFTRQASS